MEDYDGNPESRDTRTAYIIVAFLGIIAVGFLIFLIIYFSGSTEKPLSNETEGNYTFEIQASVGGQRIYGYGYQLSIGSETVQEGILDSNFKTEYAGVLNNTNYTLKILTDDYYETEQVCNILQSVCNVDMVIRAKPHLDYLKYSSSVRVILFNEIGKLRDVVFCVQDNSFRVLRLEFEDKFFKFDDYRLSEKYDDCYYPVNRAYLSEEYLYNLQNEYENDIGKYNKARQTKHKSWENITITDEDILSVQSIDIEQGFFEFNINLEYDDRFEFEDRDRIRILVIDEFHRYNPARNYPMMDIMLKENAQ